MPTNNLRIFLCRHGETAWSLSGQHTGVTDIPLTEKGREDASSLKQKLANIPFEAVYTSPRIRAKATCELAGFGSVMRIEPLAAEWNYGAYEGRTSKDILKENPKWNLFTMGAPQGESPEEVAKRADLFIEKCLQCKTNALLFSHGHFLRILAIRWIGLNPSFGDRLKLDVATVSILGFEKGSRAIALWNCGVV